MFDTILSLVITPINSCFEWITQIDLAISGTTGFTIALLFVFTIYTVTRLLLVPLIGSASSDLARSTREQYKDTKRRMNIKSKG